MFMQADQVIDLEAPDLASNSHTLTVNGTFTNTQTISFDGGTVSSNALAGVTVVIDNENYTVSSNTANQMTLDRQITVSNNTVIHPDDGAYLLSNQMVGLLLVFAMYNSDTKKPDTSTYHVEIFPKEMRYNTLTFHMVNAYFSRWATKMLTATNDQLIGNANNNRGSTTQFGITYSNTNWVLTAVYGI